MKRFNIIAILITICGITAMAQDRPDLTHQTGGDDRNIFKFIMDVPTLTYDEDAQEIIVQGSQAEYYTVSITATPSQMVVLETVIDGEYDVIDVSMLTAGSYDISLTSSNRNIYSWTFNQSGGLSSTKANSKSHNIVTNTANDRFSVRE